MQDTRLYLARLNSNNLPPANCSSFIALPPPAHTSRPAFPTRSLPNPKQATPMLVSPKRAKIGIITIGVLGAPARDDAACHVPQHHPPPNQTAGSSPHASSTSSPFISAFPQVESSIRSIYISRLQCPRCHISHPSRPPRSMHVWTPGEHPHVVSSCDSLPRQRGTRASLAPYDAQRWCRSGRHQPHAAFPPA